MQPASPRTFARFTGRFGGIPRRAGLANYRSLGPTRVVPGLCLAGGSVFPGQITLATAVGGVHRLDLRVRPPAACPLLLLPQPPTLTLGEPPFRKPIPPQCRV